MERCIAVDRAHGIADGPAARLLPGAAVGIPRGARWCSRWRCESAALSRDSTHDWSAILMVPDRLGSQRRRSSECRHRHREPADASTAARQRTAGVRVQLLAAGSPARARAWHRIAVRGHLVSPVVRHSVLRHHAASVRVARACASAGCLSCRCHNEHRHDRACHNECAQHNRRRRRRR